MKSLNRKVSTFGPTRQGGISLVEIMVALTLSLALTGGALTVYLGTRQSYRTSDAMARIQENARYAFQILGRDLRMAGYRGCAGDNATLTNTLNDPGAFLWNFDQPIYGYEASSESVWNLPPDDAITNPLGGRDIVVVRGTFGNGARVLQHSANEDDPSLAVLRVSADSDFTEDDEGEVVLVTDCLAAAVFRIAQIHSSDGFDNIENDAGLGKSFEGGELQRISTKVYYIRNNPAGRPALYRKEGTAAAQEMVDGVQDMQILYGVDETDDTAADRYETAAWVEANGRWDSVVAVKVALLLRSAEDGVLNTPQTYFFDSASVAAADRRLYQAFETTFTLRNRVN